MRHPYVQSRGANVRGYGVDMTHQTSGQNTEREPIIAITGLRKRYRLGQIGSGTLQGDIKEWRERRQIERSGEVDGAAPKRDDDFYALDALSRKLLQDLSPVIRSQTTCLAVDPHFDA